MLRSQLTRLCSHLPRAISLQQRTAFQRMVHTEAKIAELGYVLPAVKPAANYKMANVSGNHVYTAGHISQSASGDLITGKLGADLQIEDGYAAAQRCVISLLATLKNELGDLDRIEKVVKVLGFVNCQADFYDQAKVVNGASDLLIEILGERGRHARSAVGTNVLPFNVAVEVEMIVQIKD